MGVSRFIYIVVGLALAAYTALWVAAAAIYAPTMQWFSYYVVDYRMGFVRRGLGGEIVDLFPSSQYFTVLLTLRWFVPALFILSLIAVAWTVAARFGRAERRLMLALLIPVLPFGVVHAIALPTPNLLGGAALALFAVALTFVNTDRSIMFSSAIYGFTIALLSLIHEAVGLLLPLGAILAVIVLARHRSIKVQRFSAILAVVPGLAVVITVMLVGRRDVTAQCERLPHVAVEWPVNLPMNQILAGQHAYTDYHDWVCSQIIALLNVPAAEVVKVWAHVSAAAMFMTTLFGVAVLAATLFIINKFSGVPFRRFCGLLRGRLWWVIFGIALLLPVFATGADWVRWWVAISFDVGAVYVLYAASQPESAQPATRRTRVFFAAVLIVLLLIPSGTVSHIGFVKNPPPVVAG